MREPLTVRFAGNGWSGVRAALLRLVKACARSVGEALVLVHLDECLEGGAGKFRWMDVSAEGEMGAALRSLGPELNDLLGSCAIRLVDADAADAFYKTRLEVNMIWDRF